MFRFPNPQVRSLALLALAFFVCGAGPVAAQQEAANVLKFEQLIRRTTGGRLALRTYATIVVPPNALARDATIIAELDLDNNTLSLDTKDEEKLSGRISVEVNFDRFPGGLTVLLQSPRLPARVARRAVGTLTGLDARARTISVDSPEEFREFTLGAGVTIQRQENEQEPRTVSLEQLGPGDEVTVLLGADGRSPQHVRARYRTASGLVRSVAARRIVLDPGGAFTVNQNVVVTSQTGAELEMADLRAGQRVTMRLHPATNEAWEITLGKLRGTGATSAPEPAPPANTFEAPKILQPQDGDVAGNTTIVKGRTAPNAKVTIKIEYVRKGILVDTKGSNPTVELMADARGDFATQPMALRGPRLLEDEVIYTFTITAVRADGKQSVEAVVKVVRK